MLATSIVLSFLAVPINSEAAVQGANCFSKGQTKTVKGVKYSCKLTGGKFRWQKVLPISRELTEAQKSKARGECVISLIGVAGFTNDDLINADAICRRRIP